MTRVIAGEAKGRRLKVPSHGTRPTSDKVRGAIFSRLQGWEVIADACVLDLFAGSGALGLEAVSRGAKKAVFVEKSATAAATIRENIRTCSFTDRCSVRVGSVNSYLANADGQFDLVFIDPPYALSDDYLARVLTSVLHIIDIDATVVVERDSRSGVPPLPPDLEVISSRAWGDTAAWFLKRTDSEA